MKEYTTITENKSRTLDSNPRASKQVPISDILQQKKEVHPSHARNANKELHNSPMKQLKEQVTQLTEEEEFVKGFKANAKVGLELTFWNEDTQRYVTNDGFPISEKEKAKAWWAKFIELWEKNTYDLSDTVLYSFKTGIRQNKELGNGTGEMDNPKIVYSDTDNGNNEIFWYQLSMDPGVVEIQTSPIAGSNIEEEDNIINSIISQIYEIAKSLQLEPGKGGGHLNVDFTSGLGGDYGLVPEIISETEGVIDMLRRVLDQEEADYVEGPHLADLKYKRLVDWGYEREDPFISTDRVKMALDRNDTWLPTSVPASSTAKNYLDDWHGHVYSKKKVRGKKQFDVFREAHAKWLSIHPTYSQYSPDKRKLTGKVDEEGIATVLHYQAINIDHLFEEVIDGNDPRRLEFRFFKSQENINEIIRSIELVARIIYRATLVDRR